MVAPAPPADEVRRTALPESRPCRWTVFALPAVGDGRRTGVSLIEAASLIDGVRLALSTNVRRAASEVVSASAGASSACADEVSVVPLADVGSRYSTGEILGVAIVDSLQPSTAIDGARRGTDSTPAQVNMDVRLAGNRTYTLRRVESGERRSVLQSISWTRKARRWASITPLVFDNSMCAPIADPRHSLEQCCRAAGLPSPTRALTSPRSPLRGVPSVRHFRVSPLGCAPRGEFCTHVELWFEPEIAGPVLIGDVCRCGMGFFAPADAAFRVDGNRLE